MKHAIILFALVFGWTTNAHAEAKCSLHAPDGCTNTNELILASGTQAAIRTFLGREQGNFLYDRPRVRAATDAIEVLDGPPDEPKNIGSDLKLFTACRAHSCQEKGAMVLHPNGRILAIGIPNYHCSAISPVTHHLCDEDMWLDIFVAKDDLKDVAISAISDWARKKIHENYTPPDMRKETLAHIEIKTVAP